MPGRIEDYGLIGDLQTAALVGRDGSIDWLCLPRFDSPACFAALLDEERAGRWVLAPAGGGRCTRRRYRGDSLVLETEWETPEGAVRVVDAMPLRGEAADVVRVVEGLSGQVPMVMELVLRFDYGAVSPWVRRLDGQWSAIAGPDAAWLDSPVAVDHQDGRTGARFEVEAGQQVPFLLTYTASHAPTPKPVEGLQALEDTSKVMAWAGVDRAVRAVERHGLKGPVARWRELREQIHHDVCERGYGTARGTFTQFYGSQGLDAALLLIPRVGFLPWHDERVVGIIDAAQRELCADGFLLRGRWRGRWPARPGGRVPAVLVLAR